MDSQDNLRILFFFFIFYNRNIVCDPSESLLSEAVLMVGPSMFLVQIPVTADNSTLCIAYRFISDL